MKNALALAAALALLLPSAGAQARAKTQKKIEPASSRTAGLGRSCKQRSDCRNRSQVCLHENDSQGKLTKLGFCALPCSSFEAGTSKVTPGQPQEARPEMTQLRKKPPARCPPKYQCRSAGAGVPIDMCVKE
jgi:hypothetical protein